MNTENGMQPSDLEMKIQEIQSGFEIAGEEAVWIAFIGYPTKDEAYWDDETTLHFCQDAYNAVKGGEYFCVDENNVPIWPDLKEKYLAILKKPEYELTEDEIGYFVLEMKWRHYIDWVLMCDDEAKEQGYKADATQVGEDDWESDAIAFYVSLLWDWDDSGPLYKEFAIREDEEHLKAVYWFASRKLKVEGLHNVPFISGRKAYDSIVNLKMLIWLAAAAGVEPDEVRKAALEAQAESGVLRKCNKFREFIPIDVLMNLLPLRFEEFEKEHAKEEDYGDSED